MTPERIDTLAAAVPTAQRTALGAALCDILASVAPWAWFNMTPDQIAVAERAACALVGLYLAPPAPPVDDSAAADPDATGASADPA